MKTAVRRKALHKARAKHNNFVFNDVEKIKAAIWDNLKDNTTGIVTKSFDNAKAKTASFQRYASKRPVKAMGASLILGLFSGVVIGFFIQNHK